eukprot:TRINITY_DN575_c1_g1_i3.p1 TRINITY_DN575_c1_g1~~TRINITY_DN575_c1_g1_i3.p1  ORF type:complete len:1076 (-),score=213.75 TRINITY_DN575_c1_g1_i3:541-3768(-)
MSRPVTKLRFVYCPSCRQLLTEFSDIPVYKCGGCGAVLKAKNHGYDVNSSASRTIEKTPVKANEEGHDFKDVVSQISGKQEFLPSTDTNVLDIGSKRELTESIATNSNVCSSSDELYCRIENTLEKNPVEENEERHSSEDGESVASNKQVILCSRETFVLDMDHGRELAESVDYDDKFSEYERNSNAISSTYEIYGHRKKGSPRASENGEESNGNGRRDANSKSPLQESQLTFSERRLTFTAQKQPQQTIQSKAANSNLNEKSQNLGHRAHDQVTSGDEVEKTIETVDNKLHDKEIVGMRRDFSKYPTNKTSQAYDGIVTSNGDGYNDDVLHQRSHLPGRTSLKPERVPEYSSNNMSNYTEEQPQVRRASLMPSNENYGLGPTQGRFEAQKRGNLQEHDIFNSVWNWMESEREDPYRSQYREARYQRDPANVYNYQNDSQSNYGHEALLCNPNSYPSSKLGSLEQDRLQLLRKVDELREKLSRSRERQKARESFPVRHAQQERYWPLRHGNDSEQELLHLSANYAWHSPGAYNSGRTGPQQCRPSPSQMPFSGLATNYRQHIDHSYKHCYQEDRQYPVQFPPCICYNKGLCGACPGHTSYHSHSHSPASSHRPMEHSQLRKQRHVDSEIDKVHYKEKRQPIKRHFLRAVAGGAPFVICYSCRKLLQLPADFLLSRRRRHRLQCGACSEVLTFWLHDRNHAFPYNSIFQVQNPAIEVDNSSDTAIRNLAFASEGDPVSCSDDYGLSFCKSYSTEGEPAMLTPPFSISQSSEVDKRHAPNSFQEWRDEKKKVSEYSEPNSRNSRDAPRSAIPFPDASKTEKSRFDANVIAPMSGPPLHRLMGYSSPGEMINGSKFGGNESLSTDFQTVTSSYATSKDSSMSFSVHEDLEPKILSVCNEVTEEDVLSAGVENTEQPSVPGIISKGPEEINLELENMKLEVSVNGRAIPDQLLWKAEERAGPISSGNYWYDSQAGFWGVMGQPCLGIIPPFIEEFNYPMAKDCAGGNTGILVNGRELHEEDLDLLSYKGLPTTKSKAYIVKSCGQVIDEESGKDMDSLGNLAPTVERLGHGFGMHIPDR